MIFLGLHTLLGSNSGPSTSFNNLFSNNLHFTPYGRIRVAKRRGRHQAGWLGEICAWALEARRAEGAIRRRAVREERCDDRKAPAGSVAEAACPLTGGSGEAGGG